MREDYALSSRSAATAASGTAVDLDELKKELKKFDLDADGKYSLREVHSIAEELLKARKDKEEAEQRTKFYGILFAVSVAFIAAILGVTVASNEITKDMRPNENTHTLEDTDGNASPSARTLRAVNSTAAASRLSPASLRMAPRTVAHLRPG